MLPRSLYFFVMLVAGCLSISNTLAIQEFPRPLEPHPIIGDYPTNGTILASYFVEYQNSNRTINMSIAMRWINGMVKAECTIGPAPNYPFYVVVNRQICNKVCWENMRRDNDALRILFTEDPNSFFFVIRSSETRYMFLYDTCLQSIESQKCRLRRTADIFMCVCNGVEVCDRSSPAFLERSECTTTPAKPRITSTRKPTTTSNHSSDLTFAFSILVNICLLLMHISE